MFFSKFKQLESAIISVHRVKVAAVWQSVVNLRLQKSRQPMITISVKLCMEVSVWSRLVRHIAGGCLEVDIVIFMTDSYACWPDMLFLAARAADVWLSHLTLATLP